MNDGNAKTILVADDDAAIRTVVTQALTRAGFDVRATGTASSLWHWISNGEGDLIITDVVLPDEEAFQVLPRIKKIRPRLPIVVMSARNTIVTAITAAELGAYDYLPKPFDLNELISIASRALRDDPAAAPMREPPEQAENLPLIGRSPAMQDIYRVLARLTQSDLSVLVTGESGSGKELVARVLHDFGKRRKGPFVAVNMAAIPRELIESELFGHEKGAFTGATNRQAGRFEQAHGGTLFLDEIGDMPMEAQTRLLRVLQQGEYMSVGGRTAVRTNVRIVAATHRDLRHLIQQGQFREDLFFRLNVVPLRLPPLRERTEDIPDLVHYFVRQATKEGLPAKQFAREAFDSLARYRWPGNVRELQNLVRRLAVLQSDETIGAAMVEQELAGPARSDDFDDGAATAPRSISRFLDHHFARYFADFGGGLPPDGLYERVLREVEIPLITAALAATAGNQLRAADLLGMNRNTLRSKMRSHGLKAPRGPISARDM
ncbi:MAG TPA: nitrogen regulation protein NR(I) [Aestuariivirgaceae bacterium]|nr:nitrogen regulation protein NR(I) [Aestuariivirgaceae bacterium]